MSTLCSATVKQSTGRWCETALAKGMDDGRGSLNQTKTYVYRPRIMIAATFPLFFYSVADIIAPGLTPFCCASLFMA